MTLELLEVMVQVELLILMVLREQRESLDHLVHKLGVAVSTSFI